ncbi:helix-turn-helix transcriptional regulator, partial [Escherichia coli]|nr:helix-turn-helix transcriptional regulator [Escherichia coli]
MVRKRVPEQHEGRRQEILAAAHRCFLRHGLQGASISMICKEAAMSPGHLYHYFPSKD